MPLSSAERAAGRRFRAEQIEVLRELNAADPPRAKCSPYSPPWFRHECAKRGNGTYAMALKSRPVHSPEYLVAGKVVLTAAQYESARGFAAVLVPAGRFLFAYLEGSCKSCGFTVRSGSGYLTVSEE